jgi:hypothetical protein
MSGLKTENETELRPSSSGSETLTSGSGVSDDVTMAEEALPAEDVTVANASRDPWSDDNADDTGDAVAVETLLFEVDAGEDEDQGSDSGKGDAEELR